MNGICSQTCRIFQLVCIPGVTRQVEVRLCTRIEMEFFSRVYIDGFCLSSLREKAWEKRHNNVISLTKSIFSLLIFLSNIHMSIPLGDPQVVVGPYWD